MGMCIISVTDEPRRQAANRKPCDNVQAISALLSTDLKSQQHVSLVSRRAAVKPCKRK